MSVKASTIRRGMNLWPPLLCSGIKIISIGEDFRSVKVELRQRWYNKNYVGVHFGGSIFAMTDPFFMLMTMNNLGWEYTVWDREGRIEFIKPGTGKLTANFLLTNEMLDEIKANTVEEGSKFTPTYSVEIVNSENIVVARVHKTLHIRKRQDNRQRIGD